MPEPAPLTTFNGFLKQIDRDADPVAACVLDRAFPLFWPGDPNTPESRKQTEAWKKLGVNYIFHDVDPPRRFSGCWSLPRHRYFSLCMNEVGDDENTVVNELTFYLDPLQASLLMFADMAVPEAVEQFRQFDPTAEFGSNITVVLIGRPGAISPVIDALDEQGLIPHESNTQREERCLIGARIPYRVERRNIDNVFDLRHPKCQEYIVEEFFKKDTEYLKKEDRSGVSSFVECLPILMHPERGGGPYAEGTGGILQALAVFVRAQGANALIYPSARSDVLAEIKSGKLNRWRGWCMVDYTGANTPAITGAVDLSPGWQVAFPTGSQIRVATGGEYAGSFEVVGIVKWNRDRIGEREAQFIHSQQVG